MLLPIIPRLEAARKKLVEEIVPVIVETTTSNGIRTEKQSETLYSLDDFGNFKFEVVRGKDEPRFEVIVTYFGPRVSGRVVLHVTYQDSVSLAERIAYSDDRKWKMAIRSALGKTDYLLELRRERTERNGGNQGPFYSVRSKRKEQLRTG